MHLNDFDPKQGPLQIIHDFKFVALNVKDDYSFVDSLGEEEKLEYFKVRIDRLRRLGYGGVVMNVDYKDYLRSTNAFDTFARVAEYAKGLGMRVWIYDEQYYPSGSAGGLTLAGHPELEAIGLACVIRDVKSEGSAIRIPSPCGYSELKYAYATPITDGIPDHKSRIDVSAHKDFAGGLCYDAPAGEWRIYCFFIRTLYELTKFCQGTRASRRYISVFNKRAVERFYDVTFSNGYCKHLSKPLSDTVEAVFTDEPYSPYYKKFYQGVARTAMPSESVYDEPNAEIEIYPYIPWEMSVPQRFLAKYGCSIATVLPDLFESTPATRWARVAFYSLLSDMARETFPEQMQNKLGSEGIALSGHYYGEEGFDFHPIFYGDILEHLSVMKIPGCDCLWSDIEALRYSTACKLAASAAHLACRDEVMIEASNMVDREQNITLEKAKAAISAMFIHGVNLISSYYGENLLPDCEMYEFTRHIASLKSLFKGGKYKVNTLLYYPFENLSAECGPQGITEGNDRGEDRFGISKTSARLLSHQVCFEFINKAGLLSCEICDGYISTKNGNRIGFIVFPDIPWVDREVCEYLGEAARCGVNVVFDGENAQRYALDFNASKLSDGYPMSDLSLIEENPYITVMNRDFGQYDLFMVMNTDKQKHTVFAKIALTDGNSDFALLNHTTRALLPIEVRKEGNHAIISTEIPSLDFVIIFKKART